jgi:hypothetical protein
MFFSGSLLFKSEHQPDSNPYPLWEECVILIEAENESDAKVKAAQHGKAGEHEYKNQAGELVRWSFERVERVCHIDKDALTDGTELFSRFLKDSEVKSLLTSFNAES